MPEGKGSVPTVLSIRAPIGILETISESKEYQTKVPFPVSPSGATFFGAMYSKYNLL
jgi:hypothetical protein